MPYSEFFWSLFSRFWTEYLSPYLSVLSLNAGKYVPEKLRLRTLFYAIVQVAFSIKNLSIITQFWYWSLTLFTYKKMVYFNMLKCDFRSVISIKLLCNFMEIGLRHGCSPVNVLHIFRTTFLKNTSGWLLLNIRINKNIRLNITTARALKCFLATTSIFIHWKYWSLRKHTETTVSVTLFITYSTLLCILKQNN